MANDNRMDSIRRFTHLIQKNTGRAIRPQRFDGFVNLMNKYGTPKDTQEYYQYAREPMIPDERLVSFYEGNGLFARIIDAPAEEAVRHGFELEDISDEKTIKFYKEALDELDWEERCMTALKWCRLFGGSIAVLLVDDGRGLEEPLDWNNIKSIDDIRIYDRSVIQPDVTTMYKYDPVEPFGLRGSRLGLPEYYNVYSRYGAFTVHDSRVLIFQNGILPEYTQNSIYQMWGIPEYLRIHRAVRDSEIAHGTAPKMLDKSIQAVYKMKGLSALMSTEEGENQALRRLQTIDMARGMMNTMLLDGEGEEYDFKAFSYSGVAEVINTTCNYLSALTNIPQTILFGRSPSGMNSTGDSDFENYYNFIERIQKRVLRKNMRYLLSIIMHAGKASGEIDEIPKINVKFNSLWSMSETEQVGLDLQKMQLEGQRAQVAATYLQMGVISPEELRKKMAEQETYDVETMLNDMYDSEEELLKNMPQGQQGGEGGAPGGAPDGGGDPMAAMMGGDMGSPEAGQDEGGGDPMAAMMSALGGGGGDEGGEDSKEAPQEDEGDAITEDEIELATAIAMEDGDRITNFDPRRSLSEILEEEIDDDVMELAQAIQIENGEMITTPIPNTRASKARRVEPATEDEIELATAMQIESGDLNPDFIASDSEIELAQAIQIESGELIPEFIASEEEIKMAQEIDASEEEKNEELEVAEGLTLESGDDIIDDDDLALASAIDLQKVKEEEDYKYLHNEHEKTIKNSIRPMRRVMGTKDLAKALQKIKDNAEFKKRHKYSSVSVEETDTPVNQNKWTEKYEDVQTSGEELEMARGIDMEQSSVVPASNIEFPQPGGNFVEVERNIQYKGGNNNAQYIEEQAKSNAIIMNNLKPDAEYVSQETSGLVHTEVEKEDTGKFIHSAKEKHNDVVHNKEANTLIDRTVNTMYEKKEALNRFRKQEESDKAMAIRDYQRATEMEIAQAIEIQNTMMRTDANDPVDIRDFTPDKKKQEEHSKLYPEKKNPEDDGVKSVGVIVVKDGKILVGKRNSRNGYGLLCGGGGHIEKGETPEKAARRELTEEFGIKPKNMIYIGRGIQDINERNQPNIYLCNKFTGEPECDNVEMVDPLFMDLEELMLKETKQNMFPPFRNGLELFYSLLNKE